MKRIRTARFKFSQLIEWATWKAARQLRVAEALDWYMNLMQSRGWKLVSACGAAVREPEIIFALDIGASQVALMRDELWSVIWEGEDADGGVDFLGEWETLRHRNDADFTRQVIENLEDLGWKLDEAKDGYVDATGERLIAGEQLSRLTRDAGKGDPLAAAEELALQGWRKHP